MQKFSGFAKITRFLNQADTRFHSYWDKEDIVFGRRITTFKECKIEFHHLWESRLCQIFSPTLRVVTQNLAWVKFPSTIYVHHIISASYEKKFAFQQWPIVCSKSHLQMARFLPKLLKIAECSPQWRDSPELRCVVCPIGIFLNHTFYQSIIEIWIWFTHYTSVFTSHNRSREIFVNDSWYF